MLLSLVPGARAENPGSIHVNGKFRVVNGTSQVPAGLFGVHATPLTPEMVAGWGIESVRVILQKPTGKPIVPGASNVVSAGVKQVVECFYDRYQPALLLTDPSWKSHLETLARNYAGNAKITGFNHVIEFWNEPYLNWASKPGVNYDGALYEPGVEGAPMTLKGWDKPLDSLIWSKQLVAVDEASGHVNYLASSYALPLIWKGNLKEGDEYVFRQTTKCRIESLPWGKDPGQASFVSGPQNSLFYRWMFVPFAKALKETNPDVQLVGGWDFNISQDDWLSWPVLFKPLIDDSIQWLDGIDEHHYGGDTRMVAGTYEVVSAYAQTAYGKHLKFYNTEAGGLLDPERPDALGAPKWTGDSIAEKNGAASYFLRDVIHMIDNCPDKAAARAAHEANKNGGNEIAFKLLKDLRGNLLSVKSTDPRVWAVASVSGRKLCLVVFNDNATSKIEPVKIDAPSGTEFESGECVSITPDITLASTPVTASGKNFSSNATINSKSAIKWTFELNTAPDPANGPTEVETQYCSDAIINRLGRGRPVAMDVKIPAEVLKSATGARLKIVQEGWADGTVCTINGRKLNLDVNETWTHIQSLDPALLQPVNKLVFETQSSKPVKIDMASIVIIAPR